MYTDWIGFIDVLPHPPAAEFSLNSFLVRLIDIQYTKTPIYGYPKMAAHLRRFGCQVNPKRIRLLMRLMDIREIHPKLRTTVADNKHKRRPYLLRGLAITRPNQVWGSDITCVPM